MTDYGRLLKKYYNYDGSDKYVKGERWNKEKKKEYNKDNRRKQAWKALLTQMNEIRGNNPEISLSEEQRNLAKDLVYSTNYNVSNYNTQQVNLMIIIYIFNYLYDRHFDFSKYLVSLDLSVEKVEYFIVKYVIKIKDEKDIIKEIYKMRQKRSESNENYYR